MIDSKIHDHPSAAPYRCCLAVKLCQLCKLQCRYQCFALVCWDTAAFQTGETQHFAVMRLDFALSVAVFAILGLFARMGSGLLLTALLEERPAFIFVDLPANLAGGFVAGLLFAFQSNISALDSSTYFGLVSGFCGSLTTLSGMNQSLSVVFLDRSRDHEHIYACLGWLVGIGLILGATSLGADAADGVRYLRWSCSRGTVKILGCCLASQCCC
jgi:fluoride ion exporter CrcB/FEX